MQHEPKTKNPFGYHERGEMVAVIRDWGEGIKELGIRRSFKTRIVDRGPDAGCGFRAVTFFAEGRK